MLLQLLAVLAVVSPHVNSFFLNTLIGAGPSVVTKLDVDKYLGKWYQMYASPSVRVLFEQGAVCVTADYGLASATNITVLNFERITSPTGAVKTISGYAQPTSEVGKLIVTLETAPFPAPYWVLKLGPESFGTKGLYQYSIISDNVRGTLFVLARDPEIFTKNYDKEVTDFLKGDGFTTFYNRPVPTYQGSDCQYST